MKIEVEIKGFPAVRTSFLPEVLIETGDADQKLVSAAVGAVLEMNP